MFGLKRQKGTVLVVDVDDASVGVAIVRCGDLATVVQCTRATLPPAERSPDHSATAAVRLLEETAQKAVQAYAADTAAPPLIGSYAIIRSPWTRFRTTQAEEAYEAPVVVTEKLIESLAKKALQSPSELDQANRLESGVVHVYLNGYVTDNPIGKHVTRTMVTAYESDIKPEVKSAIEGALMKVLPGRTPVVRSSMCALLNVIGEHLPELHRCVIIDVGSTSTHCAVVLKEAVTQAAVVSEGLATVISRVAGAALPEEVITQLRMLANDTCATDACKAVKDSLARIEPDLAKSFGEAFAKLATPRRLPNAALLSAPVEVAPWLSGFFSRIDFAQFTATLQPLSIEPLTSDHLTDVVTWEGRAPDTGLGVAAAYVNILGVHG
jgi:hypothetical protein